MATRGDIFSLNRRVGFGGDSPDHVVVLQSTQLNGVLPTVLVAPLDEAAAMYEANPLMVPVPAVESGLGRDTVLVLTALTSVSRDRLGPAKVGALGPERLLAVGTALAILLGMLEIRSS